MFTNTNIMKKLWISFLLVLLAASVSFAQNFKPFKVGLGLGYAVPAGGEGGALLYVEPGYRCTNNILIGLRLESAIISRGLEGTDKDVTGDATSNASYTLNGQYYFNENYVRPFVGLGFGLFSLAALKYNRGAEVESSPAETRFGFYPRAGVDIGHLNLTLDYNIVPRIDVMDGGEIRNSYLGLRAGFSIGGGVGKREKI
jgi:hypothetical protein